MHFGLIRERKTPPDHRVVLSPAACQKVLSDFPEAQITVESSPIRVFTDQEYRDADITVSDSIAHCDVLLGVKEVPISELISNKKYFFFSHTIKKQPYNRKLLQTILDKNIEFYDHEVITNPQGIRLVAFGRYAGIVGAYNGIRAYGLKHKIYELPKAQSLKDRQALIEKLNEIRLPAVKILVTGKGRVGGGVREMLTGMNLKEVTVDMYINNTFDEAVFCQIDVLDYNRRKGG
ncbi:MAG: alanine dehydrogenase, partial [Flavobacteriaceae bacterium]|nr:alanine dehydrogenase [Flavobacteriaceae bacterium]